MLADSFGISSTGASFATQTWFVLLSRELKFLIKWPFKEQIIMNLPYAFTQSSNTRAIIDCTEYYFQKPQSPAAQNKSRSDYKHSNTFKQLVGSSRNEAFIFLSQLYSGRISDREITEKCSCLNKLVPGDDVMAEHGFTIRDLLALIGHTLNMSPLQKESLYLKRKLLKLEELQEQEFIRSMP